SRLPLSTFAIINGRAVQADRVNLGSSVSEFLEVPQPDLQAFQFVPRESFRLLRRCEPLSHLFCRVSPQTPPRNGCRWRLGVRHSGLCPLVSCLERFVLPASF